MNHTFSAHFDGRGIVPDEPVDLPVGRPLRVRLEVEGASGACFAELLSFAADLPDAPRDLASQHDHYLYGTQRR
jgi:hypothetical protein